MHLARSARCWQVDDNNGCLGLVVHEVQIVPRPFDSASRCLGCAFFEFGEDGLDDRDHSRERWSCARAFDGRNDDVVGVGVQGRRMQVGENRDRGTLVLPETGQSPQCAGESPHVEDDEAIAFVQLRDEDGLRRRGPDGELDVIAADRREVLEDLRGSSAGSGGEDHGAPGSFHSSSYVLDGSSVVRGRDRGEVRRILPQHRGGRVRGDRALGCRIDERVEVFGAQGFPQLGPSVELQLLGGAHNSRDVRTGTFGELARRGVGGELWHLDQDLHDPFGLRPQIRAFSARAEHRCNSHFIKPF